MNRPETSSDITLQLRRTYPAARQIVFEAWTRADELSRWFNPDPKGRAVVHALEAKPGGRYRVEMIMPDGSRHVMAGTYREVRAPERLVFTWAWEGKSGLSPETVVTIELLDRGASTELVLTHERFGSAEERDKHNHGWLGCLESLARALDSKERSKS